MGRAGEMEASSVNHLQPHRPQWADDNNDNDNDNNNNDTTTSVNIIVDINPEPS